MKRFEEIKGLRSVIEKILNFKSSGDVAKDFLALQEFEISLKKLPAGLLKQFGELLLAKESKNSSALKRLMEEVIHWEYRVIPFFGVDIPLGDETWSSVDKLLVETVKSFDDQVMVRAFATRVFQLVSSSRLPQFSSSIDTEWSLNELRKLSTSPWYGIRYPAFWFSQLQGRVTQSELTALVDQLLTKLPAPKWNDYDLWVFSEWLPTNEAYRGQIVDAITKIKDRKEPYLQELIIRMAENSILRRILEKKEILNSKALFKLKRDFYLDLLEKGVQVDYALYQLVDIGDEDKNYLWWYAFNPFLTN